MLSKRLFLSSVPFCLSLMFSACAGVSTDPGEGGLLGGIKGLTTGEYDRRIDERQTRLTSIQDHNRQAEQENLALQKRNEALGSRISRMRRKTDALKAELRRLQAQGSKGPRRAKLTKMQQRLAVLDAKHKRLNQQPSTGKIDQQTLEQEFNHLEREAQELEQHLVQ